MKALVVVGTDFVLPGALPSFDGWLDTVYTDEYAVDERGREQVEIGVGAESRCGGPFTFDAPVIRVDAGTEVQWIWTGMGGEHDVVGKDVDFRSALSQEEGYRYSRTFDEPGVVKYHCRPQNEFVMRGVVVVVDPNLA